MDHGPSTMDHRPSWSGHSSEPIRSTVSHRSRTWSPFHSLTRKRTALRNPVVHVTTLSTKSPRALFAFPNGFETVEATCVGPLTCFACPCQSDVYSGYGLQVRLLMTSNPSMGREETPDQHMFKSGPNGALKMESPTLTSLPLRRLLKH